MMLRCGVQPTRVVRGGDEQFREKVTSMYNAQHEVATYTEKLLTDFVRSCPKHTKRELRNIMRAKHVHSQTSKTMQVDEMQVRVPRNKSLCVVTDEKVYTFDTKQAAVYESAWVVANQTRLLGDGVASTKRAAVEYIRVTMTPDKLDEAAKTLWVAFLILSRHVAAAGSADKKASATTVSNPCV